MTVSPTARPGLGHAAADGDPLVSGPRRRHGRVDRAPGGRVLSGVDDSEPGPGRLGQVSGAQQSVPPFSAPIQCLPHAAPPTPTPPPSVPIQCQPHSVSPFSAPTPHTQCPHSVCPALSAHSTSLFRCVFCANAPATLSRYGLVDDAWMAVRVGKGSSSTAKVLRTHPPAYVRRPAHLPASSVHLLLDSHSVLEQLIRSRALVVMGLPGRRRWGRGADFRWHLPGDPARGRGRCPWRARPGPGRLRLLVRTARAHHATRAAHNVTRATKKKDGREK